MRQFALFLFALFFITPPHLARADTDESEGWGPYIGFGGQYFTLKIGQPEPVNKYWLTENYASSYFEAGMIPFRNIFGTKNNIRFHAGYSSAHARISTRLCGGGTENYCGEVKGYIRLRMYNLMTYLEREFRKNDNTLSISIGIGITAVRYDARGFASIQGTLPEDGEIVNDVKELAEKGEEVTYEDIEEVISRYPKLRELAEKYRLKEKINGGEINLTEEITDLAARPEFTKLGELVSEGVEFPSYENSGIGAGIPFGIAVRYANKKTGIYAKLEYQVYKIKVPDDNSASAVLLTVGIQGK